MTHELSLVGCNLRSDSRLCSTYIEHGDGGPKEIAKIMAEMQFYHAHTEYQAIRDEIFESALAEYKNARDEYNDGYDSDIRVGYNFRDFSPTFRDYFNADEASEEAQEQAFERWLDAQPTLEAAIESKELPATLRRRILGMIGLDRFKAFMSEILETSELSAFKQYEALRNELDTLSAQRQIRDISGDLQHRDIPGPLWHRNQGACGASRCQAGRRLWVGMQCMQAGIRCHHDADSYTTDSWHH